MWGGLFAARVDGAGRRRMSKQTRRRASQVSTVVMEPMPLGERGESAETCCGSLRMTEGAVASICQQL